MSLVLSSPRGASCTKVGAQGVMKGALARDYHFDLAPRRVLLRIIRREGSVWFQRSPPYLCRTNVPLLCDAMPRAVGEQHSQKHHVYAL